MIKDKAFPESATLGFRHLEDILESSHFKNAPVLSGLLLYLWQNRDTEFSEYAVAVEALGRRSDFEPKIDATVRVHISRLRKLLGKYYESNGSPSRLRIVIPLGTHGLQLVELPSKPLETPAQENRRSLENAAAREKITPHLPILSTIQGPTTQNRFLVTTMGATIVVLLSCIGLLLWPSIHRRSRTPASPGSRLPVFWKTFSDNGKSFRLVLPVPVFLAWNLPNNRTLLVRDTAVNDFASYNDSDEIAGLVSRMGKPSPWQGYATLSDAFAALQLVRFLDSYGIHASISSSAESPQEIIEHENIVAFGSSTSLGKYQTDIDRLSYQLGPHEAYVIDRHLPPGSPAQFPEQHEAGARSVQPGLVAFLPQGSSGSRILILQGAQTLALISWLTSEEGMREIAEAQAAQAKGPYFEAVVLSEVNGENPIQSQMVAFRPVFIK
jgi:hypothetical protein